MLAQNLRGRLLDEFRLPLLDDQHRFLAGAELHPLIRHQRIGHIEAVQRDLGVTKRVGAAQELERAQRAVVEPTLQNDADVIGLTRNEVIQTLLGDETHRRRKALLDLLLLLRIRGRRQDDLAVVTRGRRQRVGRGKSRPPVGLGREPTIHMTRPDAEHQHHRSVTGFR